jgi:hypothetical protein
MNFLGNAILSDSSRTQPPPGFGGFILDVTAPDINPIAGLVISDSTLLGGDATFFPNQILGPGDLTLTLRDWTYFGGIPYDATTFIDGTWMFRWYDPVYLSYSIWYQSYDTSQFSLIGYKYRNPVHLNVGSYYSAMVVPKLVGHYQERWLYLRDNSGSYAHELRTAFTAVSSGLDAMPDYPYALGQVQTLSQFAATPEEFLSPDPGYVSRGIVDGP